MHWSKSIIRDVQRLHRWVLSQAQEVIPRSGIVTCSAPAQLCELTADARTQSYVPGVHHLLLPEASRPYATLN